jgi:hypothetical protein
MCALKRMIDRKDFALMRGRRSIQRAQNLGFIKAAFCL